MFLGAYKSVSFLAGITVASLIRKEQHRRFSIMIAKVLFLCSAFAAAHCSLISTGTSISSRQQDGFGNYGFNYGIADALGATNSRAEVGDAHGNKKGTYTITDIDGRVRRVDYVADALGFRAAVKTNEPGTAASAPAAALVASPYAGPVAPVAVGHTVAAVAPVAAAPVYAAAPALAAGHLGYGGHIGYAAGIAAPIGYAGHIGYGAGLAKAIY